MVMILVVKLIMLVVTASDKIQQYYSTSPSTLVSSSGLW